MTQKTYSQILNEIAEDGIPASRDLTPQIIARIEEGIKVPMKRLKKSFVFPLVMTVVLMTATSVVAAKQHWFGYIPGFGMVSNGQLRELAEPVRISRNDITLNVDKVVLSSEKTLVTYSLEGMMSKMQDGPGCFDEKYDPVMRLPDGSSLEMKQLVRSDTYHDQVTFGPMPADVNEATLIIHCVGYASPEQVPQHWEVPLRFVPASPALTIMPVLDAPTSVASTHATTAPSLTATIQPDISQEELVLQNVIPIQGGYILSGTITVVPPAGYTVVENYGGFLEDVTITDANGQALAFDIAPDDFNNSWLPSALPEKTYFWAGQVLGKNIQWPLMMTVHSLAASGPLLPQAMFQLEVGPDPKADQVWNLNRDVPLGEKTAHIVSIRRLKGDHGLSGYEFTLTYDPTLDFWPEIKGYQRMGGGGQLNENGTYTRVLAYPEPVPSGVLTVIVNGNELTQLSGPWQATWQKPVDTDSMPTP